MRARIVRVLGLTLLVSITLIAPASAYIDPGSTTVVFQALIAGLAAAGMGLKMFWGRIANLFHRAPRSAGTPPASATTADDAGSSAAGDH